jgi:Cu+-exporting ATPase
VVLDRTGTVTTGRMSLVDAQVAEGVAVDEVLRLAGALENASGIRSPRRSPAARRRRSARCLPSRASVFVVSNSLRGFRGTTTGTPSASTAESPRKEPVAVR